MLAGMQTSVEAADLVDGERDQLLPLLDAPADSGDVQQAGGATGPAARHR
jgi:hypothetical protein